MLASRPTMTAAVRRAVLLLSVLGLLAPFARAQNESNPTTPKTPETEAAAQDPLPNVAVGPNRVENMRTALEKWIETQRLIAKRKNEWQLGKRLLTQRIGNVKQEITTQEAKAAESKDKLGKLTTETEELRAEEAELKAGTKVLDEQVLVYEERLRKLEPRLPKPLRSKIAPVFLQIPKDAEDLAKKKLSLGQRFVNLLLVLKEIHKFNSEPIVENETLTFGDKNYNVAVIYFGISQGYYVSNDKKVFGFGSSTEDGWQWLTSKTPQDAESISQAIAIAQNAQPAAFVPLPITIKDR